MTDFSSAPPEPVAYVTGLLGGLDVPWLLCGGWAADAWLGRQTRSHVDVDIAVFHEDQRAVFEHFPGWALVGHDPNVPDATTEQWNGRRLDLPAHVHVTVLGSNLSTQPSLTHSKVEFEFLLSERSDGDWVLNTERRIAVPADPWWTPWGIPAARPEVILFFKAGGGLTAAELAATDGLPRAHDEQDFHALLPTLSDEARTWLHDALTEVRPDHPWVGALAG